MANGPQMTHQVEQMGQLVIHALKSCKDHHMLVECQVDMKEQ